MIPTSADFAMVLTFNKGQKKEEAIDKILYALNVIEPEYAHRMPLANNSTILILLGNGLFEEKTRRDSTLKIYEADRVLICSSGTEENITLPCK